MEASIIDSVTFLPQSCSPLITRNVFWSFWLGFRHQIHFQDWNWSESERNRGNVSSKRSQNRFMDDTRIDFWWWFWQAGDFLTQKYMFALPRMYFGGNFGASSLVRTSAHLFHEKKSQDFEITAHWAGHLPQNVKISEWQKNLSFYDIKTNCSQILSWFEQHLDSYDQVLLKIFILQAGHNVPEKYSSPPQAEIFSLFWDDYEAGNG